MTIIPINHDDCHRVFLPGRGRLLRQPYQATLISAGRISPDAPCSAKVARAVSGVMVGLTSTMAAPRRMATRVNYSMGSARKMGMRRLVLAWYS